MFQINVKDLKNGLTEIKEEISIEAAAVVVLRKSYSKSFRKTHKTKLTCAKVC